MNAHENPFLLGGSDNHALWLVQRKAHANQQMRELVYHHWNVACKEAKRLFIKFKKYLPFGYVNEFAVQTYGCSIPSAPVVVLLATNQSKPVS